MEKPYFRVTLTTPNNDELELRTKSRTRAAIQFSKWIDQVGITTYEEAAHSEHLYATSDDGKTIVSLIQIIE